MEQPRIKPIVILPAGEMTKRDIKKLNDNGICVVEAKDPAKVRFADPPPLDYSVQERAAIELFRVLMARSAFNLSRLEFASMYAGIILEGMQPARVTQAAKAAKHG